MKLSDPSPSLAPETSDAAPANHAEPERTERVLGLVRAHQEFVNRSVRRLGVPEAIADDVAQNVFLTASRKLDTVAPSHERAFLFGIATRMASDVRRSRQRNLQRFGHGDWDPETATCPSGSPEELLARKQQREFLEEVLETLPPQLRTVFVMHELEELTLAEIARTMAIPEGTAASQLRRARAKFDASVSRIASQRRGERRTTAWLAFPLGRWFEWTSWFTTSSSAAAAVTPAVGAASAGVASGGAASAGSFGTALAPWLIVGAVAGTAGVAGVQLTRSNPPPAASVTRRESPHVVTHTRVTTPAAASAVASLAAPAAPSAAPSNSEVPRARQAASSEEAPQLDLDDGARFADAAPSLQHELALLRTARASLAAADGAGAIALLDRYQTLPLPHELAQEAQVLRVRALALTGQRDAAHHLAQEYVQAHPRSPQAPAMQKLIEAAPR
jgi:RNA polymerase sigma-70 factor (ECF subfamily)